MHVITSENYTMKWMI
ncbi:hypothetical protein MTR67_014844 [Solanum verrucosum]|uniref:Uncharacterized protein n=1 Tax=Solanum verrucosum TaxID=315347 RepID=A0AAF0TJL3_SOLVR|nr:hypothetical protein MTR67_014844 [Solanum verrucosum]